LNHVKTHLQLMEFYNHLPCACITVDVAGKIVNANNTFLKYTGHDRDDIINILMIEDFLPTENHDQINHLVDLRHNQSEDSDISYVSLITKGQQKLPCTISSMVLNTEDAIYYYYSFIAFSKIIAADKLILDEKIRAKLAEQKLKKLTLELHKINTTITHEIQNPLQNILGLITILKQTYVDSFDSRGLTFLDHIGDSGEKMNHHFNALLKNSTNGKSIINKKYVDLNEIIDNIKLKHNDLMSENQVNLLIPEPLPSVFGIEDDLWKLFNNLIKNSIQFKKENKFPIIKITFKEEDAFFQFTIEDNGKGIDEKYHEKIFEDYFKINDDGDDCTGRGLPESRRIVENHNGSIGVISNKNKGCTIYFSLEK